MSRDGSTRALRWPFLGSSGDTCNYVEGRDRAAKGFAAMSPPLFLREKDCICGVLLCLLAVVIGIGSASEYGLVVGGWFMVGRGLKYEVT